MPGTCLAPRSFLSAFACRSAHATHTCLIGSADRHQEMYV
ncbi:hypothetical protein NSU_4042 [Novosphingobium pentaromativorans US6-1]|uniref:Uncharacterized protein n=1 Tax=Novosphingobium pentaromativorans US6-1 TaxID=1088721 RepID=G6EI70_9SPHN|nr:hypothetical protein NSU_4042 [Novosphingobium pentaromativorans US6-1]